MTFTAIKQMAAWMFPAHAWTYNDAHDARACAVCGRTEEFDCGGGMFGSAWCYVERGSRGAHVTAWRAQCPVIDSAGAKAIAELPVVELPLPVAPGATVG